MTEYRHQGIRAQLQITFPMSISVSHLGLAQQWNSRMRRV